MNLSAHDLSVARGGLPLLQSVNFRLDAGRALMLRGPNGIGQTTLLRVLAGLQPPLSGRLEIASDRVAYIGHLDGLKSTLTVSENLAFWASIFGQTGLQAALDRFNLSSLQNRPAGMLSAGQKRRLGLARLMVTGRKVWLLDEPTVSLDATNVVLFTDVLRDHLDAGGSAIIASHPDIAIDGIEKLDLTTLRVDLETVDFLGEALL